ncbi:MAG: BBP7 family outer membrane beta-barrel protein [Planctomycetes bacterium]|nr:BBP7 family outer membrane beta-barrel protein [Planctomycetota bacterium]
MPEPVLEGDQQGDDDYDRQGGEGYVTTPHADSWESGDYTEQLEPYFSDDYQMFQCDEPVLESTGTWIRRGFWYAEVDAVIFKRDFNLDPIALIGQPVGISIGPPPLFIQSVVQNQMVIDGNKSATEAVPRFTLGRFLFRDHHNRDHVGELTIYGGGEWTRQSQLDANPNNNLANDPRFFSRTLIVPVEVDAGNISFDGATSSQFRYDSRFNSFELNYHVKERMGRDHMEMEPSGHWVRRAGPSVSRSLLAGIRFFDLNEDLAWGASGIDIDNNPATPAEVGDVRIHTDNDMIGTQLGFTWFYETARWSGGIRAKSGMYLNIIDVRINSVIPTPTNPVVTNSALEADEMSFIVETALIGKWHLRPNFSLRAGLDLLFVTSTALVPGQLTGSFLPSGPTSVVSNTDSVYLGGSIGFEGYW